MKLPFYGKRPIEEDPHGGGRINTKIPRAAYFRSPPDGCPRCGSPLALKYEKYMLAARGGKRPGDSFVLGGEFGWYCPRCPTVVLDRDAIRDMLSHHLPEWEVGDAFAILGVVDLEPPAQGQPQWEAGDLPLLIEFNYPGTRPKSKPQAARKTTPKRSAR